MQQKNIDIEIFVDLDISPRGHRDCSQEDLNTIKSMSRKSNDGIHIEVVLSDLEESSSDSMRTKQPQKIKEKDTSTKGPSVLTRAHCKKL